MRELSRFRPGSKMDSAVILRTIFLSINEVLVSISMAIYNGSDSVSLLMSSIGSGVSARNGLYGAGS